MASFTYATYYDDGIKQYDELNKEGISSTYILDLLDEINQSESLNDTDRAMGLYGDLVNHKNEMLELDKEIESMEVFSLQVNNMGHNTESADELISFARIEFDLENLEESSNLLDKATHGLNEFYEMYLELVNIEIEKLKVQFDERGITKERLELFNIKSDKRLVVEEFDGLNISSHLLVKANDVVYMLNNDNLPNELVVDLVKESLLSYEVGNYEKSVELSQRAIEAANKIRSINNEIEIMLSEIQDESELTIVLGKARDALNANLLIDAQQYMNEARSVKNQIRAESLILGIEKNRLKKGSIEFLAKNWLLIVLIIAIGVIVFKMFYPVVKKNYLKKKLDKLKKEDKVVLELLKEAQIKYYKDKTISRENFENLTDKFQKQRTEIEDNKIMINKKLRGKTFKVDKE